MVGLCLGGLIIPAGGGILLGLWSAGRLYWKLRMGSSINLLRKDLFSILPNGGA